VAESFLDIDLKKIRPNRLNPRLELTIEPLNDLAESIRQYGLIEPIIVRPANGEYEVVVGERRYRASQQANLETIPAIVRDYKDDEVIELNLIENIHREDLSDVEKGNCCLALKTQFRMKYPSNEMLGRKLGVSSITVQRWIQTVTDVPQEVQKMISTVEKRGIRIPKGRLTSDVALQITRQIEDSEKRVEVAKSIAKKGIPVRVARKVVKEVVKTPEEPIEEIIDKVLETPPPLDFPTDHAELIRSGDKIQTSRKDVDRRIKEGVVVEAYTKFADLKVTQIEKKRLGNFTEEDAQREGGYTLEEFQEIWKKRHGYWDPDERVYTIQFEKVD
jgi:ParB family chromosome partitioning protein